MATDQTQAQPATMKAIVQDKYGPPDVLYFATVPKPKPKPKDLIVRVKAVSVNPVDTKARQGGKSGAPVPDAPKILGWDVAGIVEAIGDDGNLFQVGDEVYFAGDKLYGKIFAFKGVATGDHNSIEALAGDYS